MEVGALPTFMTMPHSYIPSITTGSFKVADYHKHAHIGFVIGFQSAAGDGTNQEFIVFDWVSSTTPATVGGMTLAYSNGDNVVPTSTVLATYRTEAPGWDILATNDTHHGWVWNTMYEFRATYEVERILIEMKGGAPLTGAYQTIFDVSKADANSGEDILFPTGFPAGRFGFSNTGVIPTDYWIGSYVPEPGALSLLAVGGLAMLRRRRR